MENSRLGPAASKPLHMAMALSALVLWQTGGKVEQPLSLALWFGATLVLIVAAHWPLKHRGLLLLGLLSWLGWYLFAWLGALMQVEILEQLQRAAGRVLWPEAFMDPALVGRAWLFAGLPGVLGFNVDIRNGARKMTMTRRGLLWGAAGGMLLAGVLHPAWWSPLLLAAMPAWLLGQWAVPGGRFKASQLAWMMACLFPLALLLYLVPERAWTPKAASAALMAWFLWPGRPGLRWVAAGAGALLWTAASFGLMQADAGWRVMILALCLLLVGAFVYDRNWVSLALAAVFLTLVLVLSPWLGPVLDLPLLREGVVLPTLVGAFMWTDPASRRWTRPAEEDGDASQS